MALYPFFKFVIVCFIVLIIASPLGINAKRNIPNLSPTPAPTPSLVDNFNSSNLASSITRFDYINYLEKYGYMDYARAHVHFGASHDEILKMAILTYQMNFGLSRTGELNDETMFKMLIPRCGVSDITDSINTMIFSNRNPSPNSNSNSSETDLVSHYDYFKGRPKWPYFRLSYTFLNGFPEHAKAHIEGAFERWANVSAFTFYENLDFFGSDIVIGYYHGDHGDGYPFDGPRGVLAHAFPPDYGRLHFDADENWSFQPRTIDFYDFETVALHEIGHILGLGHSAERDAIMYPSLTIHEFKELNEDDIDGIAILYPLPFNSSCMLKLILISFVI